MFVLNRLLADNLCFSNPISVFAEMGLSLFIVWKKTASDREGYLFSFFYQKNYMLLYGANNKLQATCSFPDTWIILCFSLLCKFVKYKS